MSVDNVPETQRLLLGRHIVDGATIESLSEKYDLANTEVEDSWLYCREKLSRHFATRDKCDYHLYDKSEILVRVTECLNLLLEWREQLLNKEKLDKSEIPS